MLIIMVFVLLAVAMFVISHFVSWSMEEFLIGMGWIFTVVTVILICVATFKTVFKDAIADGYEIKRQNIESYFQMETLSGEERETARYLIKDFNNDVVDTKRYNKSIWIGVFYDDWYTEQELFDPTKLPKLNNIPSTHEN